MKDRRWLSDSGIKRTSIGEWSVNSMPWQDTGLEVGAIENDWTYYYPGLHQPNKMLTFAVNTRALNALEENQQEILKAAMSIVHHRASVMFADKNREALRSFEQKGLDIRSFPDPLVNNAIKATSTVMNSYIENDDEAKSVWFSLRSRFTAINESH